ncbi:hypothetical protein ACFLY7_00870 [Patescibacteria group bacterium]
MDNKNNKQSSLEGLKKGLYSRNGKKRRVIRGLKDRQYNVEEDWKDSVKSKNKRKKINIPETSLFTKFLISSIVFFVFSVIISIFMFFGGINIISSQNVEIEISGPISIGGGEDLPLQITIQNNNSVDLELADLIIEYPEGTRSSANRTKTLSRHRESLGTIPSGGSITKLVQAVLFGEENSQKEIDITVEYRTADSNAIFFKEEKYTVTLSSTPISLVVDYPTEIVSGEVIEFGVGIVSNSANLVEGVILNAEYPFGFEFIESDPAVTLNKNVWEIGDLRPDDHKLIKIKGVITGQDEEERVFRFSSGIAGEEGVEISTIFDASLETVVIKKPSVGINLSLNGSVSNEYISETGKGIRSEVSWVNNSPNKVLDAEIVVRFEGDVLDKSSVSVSNGFYNSLNNTIVWTKNSVPSLGVINPGESGRVNFSFSSFGGIKTQDPSMSLSISLKGKGSLGDGSGEIVSSVNKKVKLATNLSFTPRIVYSTGFFVNRGSLPPKVGEQTTYTIIWTVMNTTNDLSNVEVSATLPPYVIWPNQVLPQNSGVTFNSSEGKVVWNVGEVEAGVGINTSPKEVSFQVVFVPSLSHVGFSPEIIGEAVITARDRFTGVNIKSIRNALTTRLSTDPVFSIGDEKVVE